MKNRVFRFLVAVVLVCCLVVSWSPISAQAMALPEVAAGTAHIIPFAQAWEPAALGLGGTVFCWVAMGLGVLFTAKAAVDAYNAYQDFTGDLETTIYYYPDGTWSYGVDMGFVERVRAFLFDAGYLVTTGTSIDGESTMLADGMLFEVRRGSFTYSVVSYSDSMYGRIRIGELLWWPYTQADCNNHQYRLNSGSYNAASIAHVDNIEYRYYFHENTSSALTAPYYGSFSAGSGGITPEQNFVKSFIGSFVSGEVLSMIEGIHVGTVAPLEVPIPDGYPEWHTNARPATNPDINEEITVLPIPFDPNTETIPDGVTQPDIWQGSIADPMPEAGTDTDPDTGTVTDGNLSNTPWETFRKWISTGWESIIQAIPTPDSIAEAVGNVIKSIFVPDADFITDKWNDIRSRFEFADSITATGEALVNILDGLDPEPPVIYIDLGATEGSYNIGGEVPFIDLRWYAQYKPTMDLIISAFLWLAFVWRLILKLPGIISGMPGEFVLMNLPVNLPHLGIGSGQRREELESGRNNRRLGDGH